MWRKKEVSPAAEAERKQWLDDHAKLDPIAEKKEEEKKEEEKKKDKEEEAPLEKGDGGEASAEGTPLEKGAGVNEVKKEAPLQKGHIMVDFHNVLEIQEEIPAKNHAAILRLLDAGVKVTVCSWCYAKRARDVMATMNQQPWFKRLDGCFTTTDRVEGHTKAWHCLRRGCDALIDDSGDILKGALEKGITVYPVLSEKNNHQWWTQKGGTAYEDLGSAVDAYLQSLNP